MQEVQEVQEVPEVAHLCTFAPLAPRRPGAPFGVSVYDTLRACDEALQRPKLSLLMSRVVPSLAGSTLGNGFIVGVIRVAIVGDVQTEWPVRMRMPTTK
jgi:hypothetical protein